MRIGLDLDNTLVTYDALFSDVARSRTLVPAGFSGGKREIRDAIRLLPDGEMEWRRLQAHVYGPGILAAMPAPGALEFIEGAHQRGIEMVIVSHKTERASADPDGTNLRSTAFEWLRLNKIVGPGAVPEEQVYFEDTRADKIARIVALHCTHFIDDLEEVLNDPAFPPDVEKFLIGDAAEMPGGAYRRVASFHEIADELFGD
jgi:hypothetical protein